MIIVGRSQQTQTAIKGRLSDGSDRQEGISTTWYVTVDDGAGLYLLIFEHEPVESEIESKVATGDYEDITDDAYWLQQQIDTLALEVLSLKGV